MSLEKGLLVPKIGLAKPFHSQEWPGTNFPLWYLHAIKQAGDETEENYQLNNKYLTLMKHQILRSNIMGNVGQKVKRSIVEVPGVKGLRKHNPH